MHRSPDELKSIVDIHLQAILFSERRRLDVSPAPDLPISPSAVAHTSQCTLVDLVHPTFGRNTVRQPWHALTHKVDASSTCRQSLFY